MKGKIEINVDDSGETPRRKIFLKEKEIRKERRKYYSGKILKIFVYWKFNGYRCDNNKIIAESSAT